MPKRGFTLIELLVVISIIGLLATLLTANLNAARSRARDAERKSDLKTLATALRLYYNDKGSYPIGTYFDNLWGNPWSENGTVYMNTVPKDPSPNQSYKYTVDSTFDSFTLSACLENVSDAQGVPANGTFSFSCTTMFQVKQ